jgi:hypothetical protein
MKHVHRMAVAGAAAIVLSVTFGCRKEEVRTTVPAPSATPGEPPNPAAQTGVLPPPPPSPSGPAERAGRAIGEQIDDVTITAKVKAALLQSPDVKGSDVNVNTEKGVVQLSGFVESKTQSERALQIARAVGGVKEVHDKMSLKSGK